MKGWRKRERNINMWLPLVCQLLGSWPTNPGMCPGIELVAFQFSGGTPATEPRRPGPMFLAFKDVNSVAEALKENVGS